MFVENIGVALFCCLTHLAESAVQVSGEFYQCLLGFFCGIHRVGVSVGHRHRHFFLLHVPTVNAIGEQQQD